MNIEQMKELIKAVSESDITVFEFEDDNESICIKKEEKMPPAPPMMQPPVMPQTAPPMMQSQIMPQTSSAMTIPPAAAPMASAVPQETPQISGNVVESPLVGTFYSSASPDAEPFVKVGDHVSKGQVLGIIEAMKLMNDIESDYDGEVVEILVNNKDMVEFGQPLFIIK
jgi:acetyl-CoA carboxylase biotin carboxyl carrier protein